DPEYLKQQRARMLSQPLRFDYIGLGLLGLGVSCWEVLLSKGQEWDWLKDPFLRVQVLIVLFALSVVALVIRELRTSHPVINFRPLADRSFAVSGIIISCAFFVLYGVSTSLPGLLQTLYGYDAYVSGLVMSPSGIASVIMLLIAGTILGRGVDARWLIVAGLCIMIGGNYWMSQMNLGISPWQIVWPRFVTLAGISLLFAPLSVAAFIYIPQELRGAAVGLYALLRNEGGSVGTSVAKTVMERRL